MRWEGKESFPLSFKIYSGKERKSLMVNKDTLDKIPRAKTKHPLIGGGADSERGERRITGVEGLAKSALTDGQLSVPVSTSDSH